MGNKGKIEPEEPPSCLVPLLQITYAWKLEIIVRAVFFYSHYSTCKSTSTQETVMEAKEFFAIMELAFSPSSPLAGNPR